MKYATLPIQGCCKFLLILALGLLGGCQSGPHPDMTSPPNSVPQSIAVEATHPEKRDVDKILELPGDVRPRRVAKLYSKVSGYVKTLRVDIGDRVQEGQELATLEAPELEHDVLSAQAASAKAQTDVSSLQAEEAGQLSLASASREEAARGNSLTLSARAELRQAQARYLFCRANYGRLKAVYDQDPGLIARQQLEKAWEEVQMAQSQVAGARQGERAAHQQAAALHRLEQAARQRVSVLESQRRGAAHMIELRQQETLKAKDWQEYLNLRAPFSGVVTHRYLDVGALLQSTSGNQPVLELMDDSIVTVVLRIPELDVPRVRPGRSVEILAEALPLQTFSGKVTRIGLSLSQESDRTMQAEVDLPNTSRKLQPGMFLRCSVTLDSHKSVLAVPTSAVLEEKGKTSIFSVENGKALKKPVRIGFSNPVWSEILSGLSGSETVLMKGKEGLLEGSPVQIVTGPSTKSRPARISRPSS